MKKSTILEEEIYKLQMEIARLGKEEGLKRLNIIRQYIDDPRFFEAVIPTIKKVELVATTVSGKKKTVLKIEPPEDKRMFVEHKGRGRNPNAVFLTTFVIPYLGRFSLFYYRNAPEELILGQITPEGKKMFRIISKTEIKYFWSLSMKGANYLSIIGKYSNKAMKKRIEKLKKRLQGEDFT